MCYRVKKTPNEKWRGGEDDDNLGRIESVIFIFIFDFFFFLMKRLGRVGFWRVDLIYVISG